MADRLIRVRAVQWFATSCAVRNAIAQHEASQRCRIVGQNFGRHAGQAACHAGITVGPVPLRHPRGMPAAIVRRGRLTVRGKPGRDGRQRVDKLGQHAQERNEA